MLSSLFVDEISTHSIAVPAAVARCQLPVVPACQFGDLVAWFHGKVASAQAHRRRWVEAHPGARQMATRRARLEAARRKLTGGKVLSQAEKRERWARYARTQRARIKAEKEAALRRLAAYNREEEKLERASRRARKLIERQLRDEARRGIL